MKSVCFLINQFQTQNQLAGAFIQRLMPTACFPALGAGCMFSRAWRWLHVFPCWGPIACFVHRVLITHRVIAQVQFPPNSFALVL